MTELGRIAEQVVECRLCPRLVAWREEAGRVKRPRYAEWSYWSRPVPGFGDPDARLMVVGLAPAAHGGNRTGRMFTGDRTADFLVSAMYEAGFANQPTSRCKEDGLSYIDAYVTAAVRCAPPGDRPNATEKHKCLPYLASEMRALHDLRAVLALGHVAFRACLLAFSDLGASSYRASFRHGATFDFGSRLPMLYASYHPSPRTTNTGRLTKAALVEVFVRIRDSMDPARPPPLRSLSGPW